MTSPLEDATMNYLLARKQAGRMLFWCSDDPKAAKTDATIDCAKRFDSPGDAMEFRTGMEPRYRDKFLVHEYDGNLLQSLDV
jgi:hypothetical protein